MSLIVLFGLCLEQWCLYRLQRYLLGLLKGTCSSCDLYSYTSRYLKAQLYSIVLYLNVSFTCNRLSP